MLTQMNFYHNKKVKVSIENVSKAYKDIEVLKDISIDVHEG
ncbi:TPA: ABC transporter ATP-binding protein, partial [Clostridioides difficile]|nr:ABC transporter ATP-binding protein [Clostridioides difficile]